MISVIHALPHTGIHSAAWRIMMSTATSFRWETTMEMRPTVRASPNPNVRASPRRTHHDCHPGPCLGTQVPMSVRSPAAMANGGQNQAPHPSASAPEIGSLPWPWRARHVPYVMNAPPNRANHTRSVAVKLTVCPWTGRWARPVPMGVLLGDGPVPCEPRRCHRVGSGTSSHRSAWSRRLGLST